MVLGQTYFNLSLQEWVIPIRKSLRDKSGTVIAVMTAGLEQIFKHSEKLIIADIAEYNPDYDVDGQTARLAARLCWDIASAMASD